MCIRDSFCDHPDANLVGAAGFLATMKSLDALKNGRGSMGAFALFPTYQHLLDYTQTPDGSDIRPLIDLVQRLGADEVMCRLQGATTEKKRSALTISTVHKAKGREWDYVEIESDWRAMKTVVRKDEMRLMYVALTRGRCKVDADSVAGWLATCESILRGGGGIEDDDEPVSDLALSVIESAKASAAEAFAPPSPLPAPAEPAAPAKKPRKSRAKGVA